MGAVAGALASAGLPERPAPGKAGKDGRSPDREAGLAAPRTALAALFEPERDRPRWAPERLADAFQMLLMAAGRPGTPEPLTTQELVELFLNGALTAGTESR